jgi:hypothetical protein
MLVQAERGGRGIVSTNSQHRWVISSTLRPFYPRKRPEICRTVGRAGLGAGLRALKISATPAFDLLTVQPVASCYKDYSIPAAYIIYKLTESCGIILRGPVFQLIISLLAIDSHNICQKRYKLGKKFITSIL